MDRRMKKAPFALAALLGLAACKESVAEADVCVLPYVPPAVSIVVLDSITGANVTPGATVVLRRGEFAESTVGYPGAAGVGLNAGGTGPFTVIVTRTGYQSWTKSGVNVEEGRCGPETVYLTARLRPA
jgi:hypothetical protein